MSGYIDKEGLLEDLGLLLEETQTKTGCSFSDDIPYGEVLACIEGNAISVEYTEQDVRDAFNDGYSCGKEESADAVPVVRCKTAFCPHCGAKMDALAKDINVRCKTDEEKTTQ